MGSICVLDAVNFSSNEVNFLKKQVLEKSIIDHIAIFIFRKAQYTKIMSANMRQQGIFYSVILLRD